MSETTTHNYAARLDEGDLMTIRAIDILEATRFAKQMFGSHVISVTRIPEDEVADTERRVDAALWAALAAPALEAPAFEDYLCRYVCGTCGSDSYDLWSAHQAHYVAHQEASA